MHHSTWWLVVAAATFGGAAACTDGLSPREILGRWEGQSCNGEGIPGDVPLWVGLRLDTVNFEFSRFQLSTEDRCSYGVALGGSSNAGVNENCTYAVDGVAGTIAITLDGDYVISGTIDGTSMELTWPNAGGPVNVLEYGK